MTGEKLLDGSSQLPLMGQVNRKHSTSRNEGQQSDLVCQRKTLRPQSQGDPMRVNLPKSHSEIKVSETEIKYSIPPSSHEADGCT